MQILEKKEIDSILLALQASGKLFPQFELYMENGKPKLIGVGGFSVIYEMQNKNRPELHYSLKISGFAKQTQTSEDFWNSARIQGILSQNSPYIVRNISACELAVRIDSNCNVVSADIFTDTCEEQWENNDGGLHLQCLLMEMLEPVVTTDRFKKTTLTRVELTEERNTIEFAIQIGQALMGAHDGSILHRDVKLENVFFDDKENVYKLGDFGIAKYTGGNSAETIVYTEGYGAPEIERKLDENYNRTADIYSFGITLYLLLNDMKFPGSDGYRPMSELQYNPDYIFPAPVNASEEMSRIIRKMCSFNSVDRYQHMGELLTDLAYLGCDLEVNGAEDVLEVADFATQTYREEHPLEEDSVSAGKSNSRSERKEEARRKQVDDKRVINKYLLLILLALPLTLKGIQTDASMLNHWLSWMLPVGLVTEAFLQQIRDFDHLWGLLLIIFTGISIAKVGLTLPHIFIIIFTLIGYSGLSLVGGIGISIWMILEVTEKIKIIDFVNKYNVGWLLIILIIMYIERLIMELNLRHFDTIGIMGAITFFCYVFHPLMLILGLSVWISQSIFGLMIPEMIINLHMIRLGIIGGVMEFGILIKYFYVDNEEENASENEEGFNTEAK